MTLPMTNIAKLNQLHELYAAAAKLAGKPVLSKMLEADGTLRAANMLCPFCAVENAADEQESSDNELVFNFGEYEFHCDTCEADYSPEQVLDKLVETAQGWLIRLEGLTLLLPLLVVTADNATTTGTGTTDEA